MGNNNTKPVQSLVSENYINLENKMNPDPRSPTPDITRTPLHNNSSTKAKITKNVDLRKTFENMKEDDKPIHSNPILSAVLKSHLQSYDPRSPTQEFERTPIIVAEKIKKLSIEKRVLVLENEDSFGSPSLILCDKFTDENDTCTINVATQDNLCTDFCDITLNDSVKEEPSGSSTATNDCIEENMVSFDKSKKFIETNFDYEGTEPNSFEDSVEDVNVMNIPLFRILDHDPRSPSVGIERTPIVVEKLTEASSCIGENVDISEQKLIQSLQKTNTELRQNIKSNGKGLENLLIYEDKSDDVIETPKKLKSFEENESRTPLSCMKNKAEEVARSKSVMNYSKNNYVPITKPKRVSHIPRLKSLSKHCKLNTDSIASMKNNSKCAIKTIGGDCENTPPHTHRDIWDKDNSVIL